MKNIEKLENELIKLKKKNLIYSLLIIGSISIGIIGVISKIQNLKGILLFVGFILTIITGTINSNNNKKICEIEKQIKEMETITKSIEDSKI